MLLSRISIAALGLAVVILAAAFGGSVAAADPPAGRQVPIKELRDRTSSLIGRDLILVGLVQAVESITEDNFDDWRLKSPCVGSYYITLVDDTGSVDVLVKGKCLLNIHGRNGLELLQAKWFG